MKNDIIAKVKKTVSKTTKAVVKFSGEAFDYTKLKLKISEIDSKLNDKYAQIGLAVYEDNEEAELEALCAEIAELREELDSYKLKFEEYKNKKTCSECGKTTERENTFCPHCGNRF